MACYRSGGCGPYEMLPCNACPASKPEYRAGPREESKTRKGLLVMNCRVCGSRPRVRRYLRATGEEVGLPAPKDGAIVLEKDPAYLYRIAYSNPACRMRYGLKPGQVSVGGAAAQWNDMR